MFLIYKTWTIALKKPRNKFWKNPGKNLAENSLKKRVKKSGFFSKKKISSTFFYEWKNDFGS